MDDVDSAAGFVDEINQRLSIDYFNDVFRLPPDNLEELSGETLVEAVLYYSRTSNDDFSPRQQKQKAADDAKEYASRIGRELNKKSDQFTRAIFTTYSNALKILSALNIDKKDPGLFHYIIYDDSLNSFGAPPDTQVSINQLEIEARVRTLNEFLVESNSRESDEILSKIESRAVSRSGSEQPMSGRSPSEQPVVLTHDMIGPSEEHESGITRMINASHQSKVFFITTEEARSRHQEHDHWVGRWENPCFSLDSTAMVSFLDVLKEYNHAFTHVVIACGMAALARNEMPRGHENRIPVNLLLHCSTNVNPPQKSLQNARDQRISAYAAMGRFLPPVFMDFLENLLREGGRNKLVRGLTLENIGIIKGGFVGILSSTTPLSELITLYSTIPTLVEMVVSIGICVVLRWGFEMKLYGCTLSSFFGDVGMSRAGGVNILSTELGKCRLGDNAHRHMIKYLGSIIHCTEEQTGHILQKNTWWRYRSMIRKDLSDFAYSFMGNFGYDDEILGTQRKFIRHSPTVLTESFYKANPTLCEFPFNVVSKLTFIPNPNELPVLVDWNGRPLLLTGGERLDDDPELAAGSKRPRGFTSKFTLLSTLEKLLESLDNLVLK